MVNRLDDGAARRLAKIERTLREAGVTVIRPSDMPRSQDTASRREELAEQARRVVGGER
jgi:hypothetical protein